MERLIGPAPVRPRLPSGSRSHQRAPRLGFAGALVLRLLLQGVPDDGLAAYVAALVRATTEQRSRSISITSRRCPAACSQADRRLREAFGPRIAGLKDSSGDLPFAREAAAVADDFKVFPFDRGGVARRTRGAFAGCISATANLTPTCAPVRSIRGRAALETAVKIARCSTQAAGARRQGGPRPYPWRTAWARVMPPLSGFAAADRTAAMAGYDAARAGGWPEFLPPLRGGSTREARRGGVVQ